MLYHRWWCYAGACNESMLTHTLIIAPTMLGFHGCLSCLTCSTISEPAHVFALFFIFPMLMDYASYHTRQRFLNRHWAQTEKSTTTNGLLNFVLTSVVPRVRVIRVMKPTDPGEPLTSTAMRYTSMVLNITWNAPSLGENIYLFNTWPNYQIPAKKKKWKHSHQLKSCFVFTASLAC